MGALDNLRNNSSGGADGSATPGSVYLGKGKTVKVPTVNARGERVPAAPQTIADITKPAFEAKQDYLKDNALRSKWTAMLAKYGLKTDPITAQALYNEAVDGASSWYTQSGGAQKVTPEQYLVWLAAAKGATSNAPALPSRSVYQYTPEQLGSKIEEVAQNLLGRSITDADKQAKWYKDLNKTLNNMVAQGTVTTTKKVKNKKTGVMEQVTIQKPEVSSEGIQQTITTALTAADPASLERKENLEFANWAFNKMGGK